VDPFIRQQLLAITSIQRGLVTVQQAASVRVTRRMLRAATVAGWLYRERRGVYAVAGAGPSPWRGVLAAALAAGPEAVVSHSTAAAIHRLHGITLGAIELIVPNALTDRMDDRTLIAQVAPLLGLPMPPAMPPAR
jgi:predicted transcriptional regulator of viral defense system